MPMPESSMVMVEFVLSGIYLDEKVWLCLNLLGVRDGLVADLVESIRCV